MLFQSPRDTLGTIQKVQEIPLFMSSMMAQSGSIYNQMFASYLHVILYWTELS